MTQSLSNQRPHTVLLVEDDELIGATIAELLRLRGLQVELYTCPGEALTHAGPKLHEFDLLLTDVVMPRMNGRQLYEAMIELRPDLPVLFMSGHTADVFGDGRDLPAKLLPKPFTSGTLCDAVDDAIRGFDA